MKITINNPVEYEAKFLKVDAGVRYWEDAKVNGVEDTDCEETKGAPTVPCAEYVGERSGVLRGNSWRWRPIIDIDEGKIVNWKQGVTAHIHYKVCDDGIYEVIEANGNVLAAHEGYVPDIMCPAGQGYGDYIIMNVDENGIIKGWKKELISHLVEQQED